MAERPRDSCVCSIHKQPCAQSSQMILTASRFLRNHMKLVLCRQAFFRLTSLHFDTSGCWRSSSGTSSGMPTLRERPARTAATQTTPAPATSVWSSWGMPFWTWASPATLSPPSGAQRSHRNSDDRGDEHQPAHLICMYWTSNASHVMMALAGPDAIQWRAPEAVTRPCTHVTACGL